MTDLDGSPVVIIGRRDGRVELHVQDRTVVLDQITASTVGAFISGHFRLAPETAERLADVLGGLVIDWVKLAPGDAVVGRTIQELEVRQRTGVSIIAILRGSVPIVTPPPSSRLEAGDDLVIACSESDRDGFSRFIAEGT